MISCQVDVDAVFVIDNCAAFRGEIEPLIKPANVTLMFV